MSDLLKTASKASSSTSAVDQIVRAFRQGRPIVPFLAAGVSVNTGFPSMAAITTYLAKVRYFIAHIYRDPYTDPHVGSQSRGQRDRPEVRTVRAAKYLRQYGWPNINRLNAAIWGHATEDIKPGNVQAKVVSKNGGPKVQAFFNDSFEKIGGIQPDEKVGGIRQDEMKAASERK